MALTFPLWPWACCVTASAKDASADVSQCERQRSADSACRFTTGEELVALEICAEGEALCARPALAKSPGSSTTTSTGGSDSIDLQSNSCASGDAASPFAVKSMDGACDDSLGSAASGRLEPRLRPAKEQAALAEVQRKLGASGVHDVRATLVPGESLESCLLRFLRAQDLRVAAVVSMLKADLAWRKAVKPAALAAMRAEAVANCTPDLIQQNMPTWHQGFDKRGRPVIFTNYGRFRFGPLTAQGVTVEQLLRLHVHHSERTALLCGQQSEKLGRDIDDALVVVDAHGCDKQSLRVRASWEWVKGMAKIDQEHYPERLGHLLVINAPQVVYYFWKALQWVLPEKVRAKVQIFSSQDQWGPRLLELVDADQLPPEYGGGAGAA